MGDDDFIKSLLFSSIITPIIAINSWRMDNKKCFTFAGGPTMAPDFLKQAFYEKLFDVGNLFLISQTIHFLISIRTKNNVKN